MVTTGLPPDLAPSRESRRLSPGPFARWPRASDAALALVLFVVEVVAIVGRMAQEAGTFEWSMLGDVPVATTLLLAVSSVALLWRRRRPVLAMTVTLVAAMIWDVMELADGPSLAILAALYSVGRHVMDDRTSGVAVVAAMVLSVTNDVIEGEQVSAVGLSLALVVVAWYVGRRMRERRAYLALLEERATFVERERAAEAQRAVDEERTRIARELHDVVAHRVSMITVQAGAAQTVAASDPERAVRAMAAVERAGREALQELRQVLGVLRTPDAGDGLDPVRGLDDVPGLIAEAAATGVEVTLRENTVAGPVPVPVALAAYRIVQEALTNIVKHAGPGAGAEVRLSTADGMLVVEVTDRGSGASGLPGSGHGLVGMRERAALLGGSFEAGHRLGGGFRVEARLPVDGRSS